MTEEEFHKLTKQELIDYILSLGQLVQNADAQQQAAGASAGNAEVQHQAATTSAQNAATQLQAATKAAQNSEGKHQESANSAKNAEKEFAAISQLTNDAQTKLSNMEGVADDIEEEKKSAEKSAIDAENQHKAASASAAQAASQHLAATTSAKGAEEQNKAATTSAESAKANHQATTLTAGEAEKLKKSISDFWTAINDPKNGYRAFIEAKKLEITQLLPDASAAGLAAAFRASKLRYGNDPQERTISFAIKGWERDEIKGLEATSIALSAFSSSIRNNFINLFLYFAFGSLLLMSLATVLLSFGVSFSFLEGIVDAEKISGLFGDKLTFTSMLARATLVSPILWMAVHINRLINRRSKLYEAYNYRQRIMELYVGFSDRVSASHPGSEGDLERLTKIVFENISVPPGKSDIHESDSPFAFLFRIRPEKKSQFEPDGPKAAPTKDAEERKT